MDQLRDMFRVIKRIHFWILCPLIILLAFVFWMTTTGGLKNEHEENLGAINRSYNALIQVRRQSPHPNENVQNGMKTLIESRKDKIREAWQAKYDQQKDIFEWSSDLTPEFVNAVKDLLPIEQKVPFPITPEKDILNLFQQEEYQRHIDLELRRLAASIGAEWVGAAAPGQPDSQAPTIVDWDEDDQKNIQTERFNWSGSGVKRRGPSGRGIGTGNMPNTLEILYAQEDLWVLRALMSIIQKTNEGATTKHNAYVRGIQFIRIGKEAVRNEGTIDSPGGSTGDAAELTSSDKGAFGGISAGIEEQAPGEGREFGGPGGRDGPPVGPDPAEGRYVDEDYQPLPAEKLRSVMQSQTLQPQDAYLAVAKRIPIRMRVTMDQRRINRLLVECANSRPTVEVRQVRINDPKSKGLSAPRGARRTFTRSPAAERSGGRGKQPTAANPFPFDLSVEVYGIVYIYNPVGTKVLDEGAEGEGLPMTTAAADTGTGYR